MSDAPLENRWLAEDLLTGGTRHRSSIPVRLHRVASPLDGSERFQWRLAAVLVALSACRATSATVEHLHTLVWAINDPTNAATLRKMWEGETVLPRPRGYVSGLVQTLKVAQSEGLIQQSSSGRQRLTDAGVEFVESIRREGIGLNDGVQLLEQMRPISSADMERKLKGKL